MVRALPLVTRYQYQRERALVRRFEARRVLGVRLVYFLSVSLVLGGILFYLSPQIALVRGGYRLQALERQQLELGESRRALMIEIASLEALERVESIARDRLGMRDPNPGEVVYVELLMPKVTEP